MADHHGLKFRYIQIFLSASHSTDTDRQKIKAYTLTCTLRRQSTLFRYFCSYRATLSLTSCFYLLFCGSPRIFTSAVMIDGLLFATLLSDYSHPCRFVKYFLGFLSIIKQCSLRAHVPGYSQFLLISGVQNGISSHLLFAVLYSLLIQSAASPIPSAVNGKSIKYSFSLSAFS